MPGEIPYANRELDERFNNLATLIREKHDDVMIVVGAVRVQTTATNGKVRKIIIALVLIAGILIGQTFNNVHDIISLLSNVI